jgi:hypothetical protein
MRRRAREGGIVRTHASTLFRILAICGLSATLALAAAAPPYDFSGPWSGTGTARKSGETATLTVDFTATANPRKFTGTTTLAAAGQTLSCDFTAKYKKKLVLHPRCSGRPAAAIRATFDPTVGTLTGAFPIGHHHPDIVDFVLSRTAG